MDRSSTLVTTDTLPSSTPLPTRLDLEPLSLEEKRREPKLRVSVSRVALTRPSRSGLHLTGYLSTFFDSLDGGWRGFLDQTSLRERRKPRFDELA